MQKSKKLKAPLNKSLKKMRLSAGTPQSVALSDVKASPNDYITDIINPDLIIEIAGKIPIESLKNFMQVNKYVNQVIREVLPLFIRQHFVPQQVRSPIALENAKNDALLNPNTLHNMSLANFLIHVRPGLLEWQYLREHYIQKFTQLIIDTEDNGENRLYNLKRLALTHPDFTEADLDMYTRIQIPIYHGHYITYPERVDLSEIELDDFLTNMKPFIMSHFNPEDKRQFIDSLNREIRNVYNRWQRQPRNQEEEDESERDMAKATKYTTFIESLNNP